MGGPFINYVRYIVNTYDPFSCFHKNTYSKTIDLFSMLRSLLRIHCLINILMIYPLTSQTFMPFCTNVVYESPLRNTEIESKYCFCCDNIIIYRKPVYLCL